MSLLYTVLVFYCAFWGRGASWGFIILCTTSPKKGQLTQSVPVLLLELGRQKYDSFEGVASSVSFSGEYRCSEGVVQRADSARWRTCRMHATDRIRLGTAESDSLCGMHPVKDASMFGMVVYWNNVSAKLIDQVLPEQLKYGHDLINMRFISRTVDALSVAMAILVSINQRPQLNLIPFPAWSESVVWGLSEWVSQVPSPLPAEMTLVHTRKGTH